MNGPYGTRWADIDELPEIVEREDAAFIAALSIWNARNALRRPEPEEMPGQPWEPGPGSLRAQAIAIWVQIAEVERVLKSTWRGRVAWALAAAWLKVRRLVRR